MEGCSICSLLASVNVEDLRRASRASEAIEGIGTQNLCRCNCLATSVLLAAASEREIESIPGSPSRHGDENRRGSAHCIVRCSSTLTTTCNNMQQLIWKWLSS